MAVGAYRTASRIAQTNFDDVDFGSEEEDLERDVTDQTISELDAIRVKRSVSKGLPSAIKLNVTLEGQLQALSQVSPSTPDSDKHTLTEQTLAELVAQLKAMSQVRPTLPNPDDNPILAKLAEGTRLSTNELTEATEQLRGIASQLSDVQTQSPISESELAKGYQLALPQASSSDEQEILAKQLGNLATGMGVSNESLGDLREIATQGTSVSQKQTGQLDTLVKSLGDQAEVQKQAATKLENIDKTATAAKTRDDEALDDVGDEREAQAKVDKKARQADKTKTLADEKAKKDAENVDEDGNPNKGFFSKALTGDFMGMRNDVLGTTLGTLGLEDATEHFDTYLKKIDEKGSIKAANGAIAAGAKEKLKTSLGGPISETGSADASTGEKADEAVADEATVPTQLATTNRRNISELGGSVNEVPVPVPVTPNQGQSTSPLQTATSGSLQSEANITTGTSRVEESKAVPFDPTSKERTRPDKAQVTNNQQSANLENLILNAKNVTLNGNVQGNMQGKKDVDQGRDAPTGTRNILGGAFGKLVTQVSDSAKTVSDGAKQLKDSALVAKENTIAKGKSKVDQGFAGISKLFNSDTQDELNELEIEVIKDESKVLKKLEKTAKDFTGGGGGTGAGIGGGGGGVISKVLGGITSKLGAKFGGVKDKIASKLGKTKVGQFISNKFLGGGGSGGNKRGGVKGLIGGLASTLFGGAASGAVGSTGGGLLSGLISSFTGVGAGGGGDCGCGPMGDGSAMPYDMDRGQSQNGQSTANQTTRRRSFRDRAKDAYSRGKSKIGGSALGQRASSLYGSAKERIGNSRVGRAAGRTRSRFSRGGRARGGFSRMAGRAGSGLGRAASAGGRIASSVGGSLLGGVGKFAKFIPGLGIAAMAGSAVMDGIGGYQRAGQNFGLEEGQEASTGQKLSSAAGGVLNGLTFGMLGEDTIAQGIHGLGSGIGSLFGFGGDDEEEEKLASAAIAEKAKVVAKVPEAEPFDLTEAENGSAISSVTPALLAATALGGGDTKDLIGQPVDKKAKVKLPEAVKGLLDKKATDIVPKGKKGKTSTGILGKMASFATMGLSDILVGSSASEDGAKGEKSTASKIMSTVAMASPMGLAASGISSLFGSGNDDETTSGTATSGGSILGKMASFATMGLSDSLTSPSGSEDGAKGEKSTASKIMSTVAMASPMGLAASGISSLFGSGNDDETTSGGSILGKVASFATMGLSDSLTGSTTSPSGSEDGEKSTASKVMSTMAMASPLGLASMGLSSLFGSGNDEGQSASSLPSSLTSSGQFDGVTEAKLSSVVPPSPLASDSALSGRRTPKQSIFDKIGSPLFGGGKSKGVMGAMTSLSPIRMMANAGGGAMSSLFGGDDAVPTKGTESSAMVSLLSTMSNLGLGSMLGSDAMAPSKSPDLARSFSFGDQQQPSASTKLAQSAMSLLSPTSFASSSPLLSAANSALGGIGGRTSGIVSSISDLFSPSSSGQANITKGNSVSGFGKIGSNVSLPPTIQDKALVNDTVMSSLVNKGSQVATQKLGSNASNAKAGEAVRAPRARPAMKRPSSPTQQTSSFHVDDYGIAVMNSILFD